MKNVYTRELLKIISQHIGFEFSESLYLDSIHECQKENKEGIKFNELFVITTKLSQVCTEQTQVIYDEWIEFIMKNHSTFFENIVATSINQASLNLLNGFISDLFNTTSQNENTVILQFKILPSNDIHIQLESEYTIAGFVQTFIFKILHHCKTKYDLFVSSSPYNFHDRTFILSKKVEK